MPTTSRHYYFGVLTHQCFTSKTSAMTNITLFGQIMQTLDRVGFRKVVSKHDTDRHQKGIDSWTHLITMLFCQFSKLNSLRDVCNGLCSASGNLNHLGLRRSPSRSSLSYQCKLPRKITPHTGGAFQMGGYFLIDGGKLSETITEWSDKKCFENVLDSYDCAKLSRSGNYIALDAMKS